MVISKTLDPKLHHLSQSLLNILVTVTAIKVTLQIHNLKSNLRRTSQPARHLFISLRWFQIKAC